MRSLFYAATEFDDPARMIEELTQDIPESISSNAVGLFFCDPEADYEKAFEILIKKVPFKIFGGTTFSFPHAIDLSESLGATLTIINKEHLNFAEAMTDSLDPSKAKEQIDKAYTHCINQLEGEPKVIFTFLPLTSVMLSTNSFISALSEKANGIPIFGSMTTTDLISSNAAIFSSSEVSSNKMLIVMLGGEINPVFSIGARVTNITQTEPVVTKSKGNKVFAVNGIPMCDYISNLGLCPGERIKGVETLIQYGALPIVVKSPNVPHDGVPNIGTIIYTVPSEGSAVLSSPIEEGARLSFSVLTKSDICQSLIESFTQLRSKMAKVEKEKNYTFDNIFCVSCAARYFVLVGTSGGEIPKLLSELTKSMVISSLFSFCEICPTTDLETGKYINRAHNTVVAMCAF